MTIYVQFELRCDGGAGPYDCEPPIYETTKAAALTAAMKQGWVAEGGKHLCPDHQSGVTGSSASSGTAPYSSEAHDA